MIGIDYQLARRVAKIAWPIIVGGAIDSILWLTDTFFVSGLGDEAVAAVGAGGYGSWFFFVASSLFYTGVLVLVAQALGAGKSDVANKVVGESLSAAFLLGAGVAGIGMLSAQPLVEGIIGARGVVGELAIEYLVPRLYGLLAGFPAMVYSAALRASGETKPVMKATGIAAAVNASLDPILIYGGFGIPGLGVKGAGIASAFSMLVELIVLSAEISRVISPPPIPRLPGTWAYRALRLGVPAYLERLVIVSGNIAYLGSVARCGEEALAAHTIGIRIESFAFLPSDGVATAAASLVGQEVGKGDVVEAKRIGLEVAKIGVLFMATAGLALVVLAPIAPHLFTKSERTAWLAMIYLVLAGLSEPALGFIFVLASSIRASGDTVTPTLVNLTGLYVFRVIPAYILPGIMPRGLCVLGAWLAMDIDLAGRAIVFYIIYSRLFERKARRVV